MTCYLENLKKLKMIDFSNNAINYFPPNLPATIEKIYAGTTNFSNIIYLILFLNRTQ